MLTNIELCGTLKVQEIVYLTILYYNMSYILQFYSELTKVYNYFLKPLIILYLSDKNIFNCYQESACIVFL